MAEEGTEGGETAGCDAEADLDVGPASDLDGGIYILLGLQGLGGTGQSIQRKSGLANVFTKGNRMITADEALCLVSDRLRGSLGRRLTCKPCSEYPQQPT